MENKVYVMTAKQAAKAFPIDEKLYAHLKELEDAGYEPDIDDEHPDASDETRFVRVSEFDIIIDNILGGIFRRIFKKRRTPTRTPTC